MGPSGRSETGLHPGRAGPVQNGYIESFNGRLRDECLNIEVFANLTDAREKIERWRRDYNQQRPHSAMDDRALEEFARTVEQRPFAFLIVNKAGAQACQGCADAGQKPPALDRPAPLPSESRRKANGLSPPALDGETVDVL